MSVDKQAIREQTGETIAALLADGAPEDEIYTIEHHLASPDFTKLEKAAVELVKVGYHVDDADEFELDDGSRWYAFAAVSELPLQQEKIEAQAIEVAELAAQTGVEYDGWGTYFGDDEEE
ncbi:ribonuclease E inhibitor RraB [Pseudidiomarina terrestris]|uniref:Ribonuclease E inhibitor RraB n=1 Tax=Pseudidiomarina terrestris TaxID=2820060 RepID=A0AAW7QWI8_9GAMM|nr:MULTISPECIES: ribonuclease E inhibitor RraB [unclassified Pseudidiomarina]MDN7123822.1 ribonuclease E inhibitor RraB [Pseudidiomarina sp. 1APP75-32.1]MDN7127576.1 ribonuclease E inhibitor RraB [Pseudidiomarina sp. 1APR75-33.1]MDN7136245.1 ribonuclease E inhibitor RraB [Pseudidiomarina sp. 1ASP75-5]MDN7138838.1 ribonuclease E inhibitor RraB [Pseudidiomarina sp. 1ASP75-14]MEA3588699.1 ribonuclease E inhibitor RraB [Pseudidiomarina sp. 1APP75-27a]